MKSHPFLIDSSLFIPTPVLLELVLEGNKALLQREQQQILALGYSQLSSMTGITSVMSILAKCPIWDPTTSEPYYLCDFDSVMTYVLDQSSFNLAVYNDRWARITAPTYGIWDTWVNFSQSEKTSQVSVPLRTRAATYSFLTLY